MVRRTGFQPVQKGIYFGTLGKVEPARSVSLFETDIRVSERLGNVHAKKKKDERIGKNKKTG